VVTPDVIQKVRVSMTMRHSSAGLTNPWPLKITLASAIDELTSPSVTYDISWVGIKWEDEEQSTSWCWKKFTEGAQADGLTAPPALQRQGTQWILPLRKENNAFRIIYRENTKSTPEDPGEPVMILFAPKAIVKFRSTAPNAKERSIDCIHIL
jgi:hypothetical protein